MYDISKAAEGFVGRSEAGVGYTISSFSNASFVVPGDLCYGLVFACVFGRFEGI
jgi:hypothetical protein